jgi:ribosomal protein S3AE
MSKKGKSPVKKRKKGLKKRFFTVEIPLTASKVYLYHYSEEDLENSVVKIDLTRNLKGKNLELRAKILLNNKKLFGEIISLRLLSSYVKKVVRRGTDYVEDFFERSWKDAKLKIKPLMVTRKRVSRSVRKAIRELVKKSLENHLKVRDSKEIFSEILTNKIQKTISQKIKKIYPLALCEIRRIEVLKKIEKKDKKEEEQENKK